MKSCYRQDVCPICGRTIQHMNFHRHLTACKNPNSKLNQSKEKSVYKPTHKDTNCEFCKEKFSSMNACVQHEIRCKLNPNRKAFDNLNNYITHCVKGHSAKDNEAIQKQVDTMKNKYRNGYIHPNKGRKKRIQHIYTQHNNEEIDKWIAYVHSLNISTNDIASIEYSNGYECLKNSSRIVLVHRCVANLLLNGGLTEKNCVHHINQNKTDNRPENLMVFVDRGHHTRFHNSPFAYLIYNEETHLFTCLIKSK